MRLTKRSEAFARQSRKGAKESLRKTFAPLRLCVGKFAAVLCGLLLLAACNNNDSNNTNTPVISAPPKSTTFPMPPLGDASIVNMGWEQGDGKRFVFSEYKGKVLILDFYATWCTPCRDSVPHLIGLQKKFEDQGLKIVGLNVGGPGDDQEVPAFAKEFGIQYTLAIPDEDLVSLLLAESDAIPQTFVFDRQGQLVDRLIGFGKGSGAQIDRAVETALKSQAP
jgi:thiol-disulfide isomerase/thioredoxin